MCVCLFVQCVQICDFKAPAYLNTNQVKRSNSKQKVDDKALPVKKICTIVMNNTVKSKLEKKQKGVNSVQKLTTLSTAEEKTKTCKS